MFDLGKYGPYIWPAFIATGVAFAWMIGDSLLRAHTWKRKAEAAQARRADD